MKSYNHIGVVGFEQEVFNRLLDQAGNRYKLVDMGVTIPKSIEDMQYHSLEMFLFHVTKGTKNEARSFMDALNDKQIPVLICTDAAASEMEIKQNAISFMLDMGIEKMDKLEHILNTLHMSVDALNKIASLEQELEMHKVQVQELTETNAHLITATFRERSLKKELAESNALIEEQQKKILDSINYSLRIQQSIIPSADRFQEALGKHFVYYKPKDVVSGDFPWLYSKNECVYFAAVDCTGHGVPGAMMSMIGNLLLNAIVSNGDGCKTPSEILAELHRSVVSTLKQDAEGNKAADGMDAALCRLDIAKKELLFSGAHLPMLLIRNGELETFKGDKFPVGGMQYRNRNTYSDHTVQLQKGDRIFVFSDGIIDQIGGPEKMKWMSASLKEFLLAEEHTPMEELKERVHEVFESYKGDMKQVDDVLLIGLEI